MATQQAGLFTQGPSVEDLLQQRNTQATNLQQQLMAQAAQGSRTPAKARAFSLLGSSLGRALSGAVGGGQDQQLAEIRAKQAAQKGLQEQALTIGVNGTSAQQAQLSQDLHKAGYMQAAVDMANKSKATRDQEDATLQAAKEKREDALAASVENEDLQSRAYDIGKSLLESDPDLAAALMSGNATDRTYSEGLDALTAKSKAEAAAKTSGGGGNTRLQNLAAYDKRAKELNRQLATGSIKGYEHRQQMNVLQTLLGATADPASTASAKEEAEGMSKYLESAWKSTDSATQKIAGYDQSLRILDTGLYTGSVGEIVQTARTLAIAMGIADEDTVINEANAEQFRANALNAAMEYIQKTSGAITEAEMALFIKASPHLSKSPDANRLLIETAKRVAQWEKSKTSAIEVWYLKHKYQSPTAAGARQFAKGWAKDNKLELPVARIQSLFKPVASEVIADMNDADVFAVFDSLHSPKPTID